MDAYKLLVLMASPESGISDYWRNRIKDMIAQVPQEPRHFVEIVTDEPEVKLEERVEE